MVALTDTEIKSILFNSKDQILNRLKQINETNTFSYETFGKEIERHINSIMIEIMSDNGVIQSQHDYHIAQNKNDFPDFTINCVQKIAIEYKSGNHRKKDGCTWVDCNNSNNDLGTLRSWEDKLRDFDGDNIIYLYVEYSFDDLSKEILDVKIDHFYKFLKVTADGVLRYRKKDGNLRPKNFNESPSVNSFEDFISLLYPTIRHRARSLIMQHIEDIPEDQRNEFLDSLKIN